MAEGGPEEGGAAAAAAALSPRGGGTRKSKGILEGLEDKLRELDVALGQCRRTVLGRIPHVTLRPHPAVLAASRQLPAGKIDLDLAGLTPRLADDAFLNEVQSHVNHWIVQIRKVTPEIPCATCPLVPLIDRHD